MAYPIGNPVTIKILPATDKFSLIDKLEIDSEDYTTNYTLVRINRSVDLQIIIKVEEWCRVRQCGKRVNLWSFAFKTEQELLMFKLRWI